MHVGLAPRRPRQTKRDLFAPSGLVPWQLFPSLYLSSSPEYKDKPASYCTRHLHPRIDCKLFKVCLHKSARAYIERSRLKGAYRKPGQGLNQGYTKASKKLKFNTGAKGIHVLAGVGQKKVVLLHYFETNWCGKVAAEAYRGPVAKALKKAYPLRTTFNVLEDNDPTGFQSNKGLKAKEELKINEFNIPKKEALA